MEIVSQLEEAIFKLQQLRKPFGTRTLQLTAACIQAAELRQQGASGVICALLITARKGLHVRNWYVLEDNWDCYGSHQTFPG